MTTSTPESYSVLIALSSHGHDPTEVAVPWSYFTSNSVRPCNVTFATPDGTPPTLDSMMLQGTTGALLGASSEAKAAVNSLSTNSASWKAPVSWSDPSFDITKYDCVFLPGGHEKGVRAIIEDESIHSHLARFFPLTDRSRQLAPGESKKTLAAICHGVQVLAFTPSPDSPLRKFPLQAFNTTLRAEDNGAKFESVIHACDTTALPSYMESSIYALTKTWLGSYYKTFGAGTPTVEDYVKSTLDRRNQFKIGPRWWEMWRGGSFVVEDQRTRYLSGRYPGDARRLAERVVELSLE